MTTNQTLAYGIANVFFLCAAGLAVVFAVVNAKAGYFEPAYNCAVLAVILMGLNIIVLCREISKLKKEEEQISRQYNYLLNLYGSWLKSAGYKDGDG